MDSNTNTACFMLQEVKNFVFNALCFYEFKNLINCNADNKLKIYY